MSEVRSDEMKFIMYEYIKVTINRELAPLCIDCYQAFGWTVVDTLTRLELVAVQLRRDRKIKNRTALSELQHKCEIAFRSIERLERKKISKATVISLCVGCAVFAIIAGAAIAYLKGWLLLSVLLIVPSLIGMALPVILFQKYVRESTEKINPVIEKYYETIYEVCDRACQLMK